MKHGNFKPTVSILLVALASAACQKAWSAESAPNIKGRVHATTDDTHFVLQTEKFFVRINRSKIPIEMQQRLLRASLANAVTEVSAPGEAIEQTWPTVEVRKNEIQNLKVAAPELLRVIGDKVQLRGTVEYSTDASQFLILSGQRLYELKTKDLSPQQVSYLNARNVGDDINMTLSSKDARRVGTIQQPPPVNGSAIPNDFYLEDNGEIHLVGTLVHSFSDPLIIVQVENAFFQLLKSRLPPGDFDSPGKTVEIKAPMSAIDFVWTLDKSLPIRQPAYFNPKD